MPSFNGWPIIALPSTPAAPASIEFSANDIVGISQSPFTAQQQIQSWSAAWMEWSVQYPAMRHSDATAWIAFLMALQGTANVFQIGDPLGRTPQGSGAGSPTVNGGSQTGSSLATTGWGSGTVLMPGDWIQIGYRLYRNLTTATGTAPTLSIWPPIRESPAHGDAIVVTNTKGLFRLKSNRRDWSVSSARVYGIRFDCREAL